MLSDREGLALSKVSSWTENTIFFVLHRELDFEYNICNAMTSCVMLCITDNANRSETTVLSYKSCRGGQRAAMFSVTTNE
jgi:hypothetical protein